MSVSMYEASVQVLLPMLNNLSHFLKKAEKNANERNIDPEVFLNARLVPDMYPLKRQVQIVSDLAKGLVARLSGQDIPSWEDTEETFEELHARLDKTIEFVGGFKAEDIDGSEGREITLSVGGSDMTFDGKTFLLHFSTPNFYFHIMTAYSILRAQGVPLGKLDYFGRGEV